MLLKKLCVLGALMAWMMLVLAGSATASPKPERETLASCYGEEHRGSLQANGLPFDPDAFTLAHKTLPFGTKLLVRNGEASAVFTVTDRGPYAGDRELDLSCGGMRFLGLPIGVHPVLVS